MLDKISDTQRQYWRDRLDRVGDPVQSVGSESLEHKWHRYGKLLSVWDLEPGVTVHDVGAGVGHLYEYILDRYPEVEVRYSASEITTEFCEIAQANHPGLEIHNRDILVDEVGDRYDYVILSGVFHQNGETPQGEWVEYMKALLTAAWSLARRGLSFNVLSPYADYYGPGNFYVNLAEVETFVVRNLSRYHVVDHASPLFEATFHILRPDEVSRRHPEPSLARYMGSTPSP